MNNKIRELAALMKLKRDEDKFVFMIGAGASMGSGIPPTQKIKEEILESSGSSLDGDLDNLFDDLWRRSDEVTRRQYLQGYLDKKPSQGYHDLASIIEQGYIDVTITFNFDDLLRKALEKKSVHVSEIIRGTTDDTKIQKLIETREPRVKLLKMHGSLYSTDTFLFSVDEMNNYPEDVRSVMEELTTGNIIICGYGFADACVIKSFADKGGTIYSVDPGGPPALLKGNMFSRRSKENVIRDDDARFDNFMAALLEELNRKPSHKEDTADQKLKYVPFKFLESYDVEDKEWFFGRKPLTRRMIRALKKNEKQMFHIVGERTSGKTSFIRAGLLSNLPDDEFEWLYLRCPLAQDSPMIGDAAWRPEVEVPLTELPAAVKGLKRQHGKRLVVVVDQFERVIKSFKNRRSDLEAAYQKLSQIADKDTSLIVLCATSQNIYRLLAMHQLPFRAAPIELEPLSPKKIRIVIRHFCTRSGIVLGGDTLNKIISRFEAEEKFTMAHVQATLHLLLTGRGHTVNTAENIIEAVREAVIDDSISGCDLINFVEDLPIKETRVLFRNLMKLVSKDSQQAIKKIIEKDEGGPLSFINPQFPRNNLH